jgi:hypothetical protein
VTADAGVATLTLTGTACAPPPTGVNIPIHWFDCDASALPAGRYTVSTMNEGNVTFTLPLATDAGIVPCF